MEHCVGHSVWKRFVQHCVLRHRFQTQCFRFLPEDCFIDKWRCATVRSFRTDCVCCLLPASGWFLVCAWCSRPKGGLWRSGLTPHCSFTRPAIDALRSIFEKRVTAVRTLFALAPDSNSGKGQSIGCIREEIFETLHNVAPH